MAILGTQSLTHLVKVRSETCGAVDARKALLEPSLGDALQSRIQVISPQIDALRAVAELARKGGSILLAGAAGTGKSLLLFVLGRALSSPFPGEEFSALCDRLQDVQLVRALGAARSKGRRWLVVLPEANPGEDFDAAVRRALNGALFTQGLEDFAPEPGRLRDEFQQTVEHLRQVGGVEGIAVLFDGMGELLQQALRGQDSQVSDFTEYCRNSRFPILFAGVVNRDMGTFQVDEESRLVALFRRVQPVTLLGRVGEWEELVGNVILEHPDDEVWQAVQAHPDQRAVREHLVRIGLYQGTSDHWLAETVMVGAHPLHPAVLFALPRVALRLASKEKTAFTFFADATPGGFLYFLKNFAVTQPNGRLSLYTVDAMYTHFEKALEQDPANKEFVEAMHKAVQAAGDIPQARRLLRSVFMFQLVGHDRLRSRAEDLIWALHLGEREVRIAQRSLELLVQKGALRYSEASEEYLLPLERRQIDLDEALERTRNRVRPGLDLTAILQRHVSLPRLVASRFNARHGTDRQAFCRLFRAAELGDPSAFQAVVEGFSRQVRPYRGDLLVAFVLADTEEELQAVRELAEAGSLDHPRLILGLPCQPASFAREALEARALDRLRALEPPFSDPTSTEYRQVTTRLEAARNTLRESFQKSLQPGAMVFRHQGQVFADLDVNALQDLVDRVIGETVGAPPALSEPALAFLRDRGHTRRQRQVALNHLLACRGELTLRTDAGVTGRILKAGLVETGILALQSEAGNWTSFNLVEQIPEQGPGRAFNQLRQKLIGGAGEARTVPGLDLVAPLLEPPHSLTPATVELLLAALFWKWPRELGLRRNWQRAQVEGRPELLEEVVPSAEALFEMVSAPEDWVVLFVDAEPSQKSFLEGILENLPRKPGATSSLWTAAGEALLAWFEALPTAARWHAQVDPSFKPVCDLLADSASAEDLRELLEVRLPRALGAPPVFSWQAESEDMLEELIGLCRTLEGLVEARLARLGVGLAEVFAAHAGGDEALEWPARARRWLEGVAEEPGRTFWREELRVLGEQVREVDDPIQAATGLLQALGHPPCEQWRHDRSLEILEVFRALREEVEWGAYRTLKFEQPDPEASVRSLVQPVLKRAGLPEEELEDLLVAELEQADWPELVVALAPVPVVAPPAETAKAESVEGVPPASAAASAPSRHRKSSKKSDSSGDMDEPTLQWL